MPDSEPPSLQPFPCVVSEKVYEPDDLLAPIVWVNFFSDNGARAQAEALPLPPVEVEIGCGNGRFLCRASAERPAHLFVGIERSEAFARRSRDRMVKHGVANVRIVRADAPTFLESHFSPGSLHDLHVYFTDPWPKRRHARRRIFQPTFIEQLHRLLRPGGRVFVKVDLHWYFEEIFGRFETSAGFEVVACGMDARRHWDILETTCFEQKALAKTGRTYYLVARSA
jgi:tRNA (guanine-N(7)-)-methyltransferase